jgi:hypothetical protein
LWSGDPKLLSCPARSSLAGVVLVTLTAVGGVEALTAIGGVGALTAIGVGGERRSMPSPALPPPPPKPAPRRVSPPPRPAPPIPAAAPPPRRGVLWRFANHDGTPPDSSGPSPPPPDAIIGEDGECALPTSSAAANMTLALLAVLGLRGLLRAPAARGARPPSRSTEKTVTHSVTTPNPDVLRHH